MAATLRRAKKDSPPPSDADSDESFDIVAFQATLDDSIQAAKRMVASWEPKDLDSNWDADSKRAQPDGGLTALREAQARPPRLGFGASASEYHAKEAENRKLRNQLLAHSKKHAAKDGNGTSNGIQPDLKRKSNDLDEDDDDDVEDSRAGSFKKKAQAAEPSLVTPQKATALATASNLFNPPTPSAMSSSGSPIKKSPKAVAGASFYGAAPVASTSTNMSGLSKNQRKKERERIKRQEAQRLKEEESRREAEADARALLSSDDAVDDALDSLRDRNQVVVRGDEVSEDDSAGDAEDTARLLLGSAVGKAPFGPRPLSSGHDGDENGNANVDASDPPKGDVSASPDSKKKKKRRRKHKENGEQTASKPLLNL